MSLTDRQVHARHDGHELVRYDIAGKWRIEYADGTSHAVPTVDRAVQIALGWERDGGAIILGVAGGRMFDAGVRRGRGAGASS